MRLSLIVIICYGAVMTVNDVQQAIELCLSRASSLDSARPERAALLREIIRLRRMADIISSSIQPEPLKSHIIVASTRGGLSFDNEVLDVIGRIFRNYDLWYRRSGGR